MKSYTYIARDAKGERKHGVLQAACSGDVLAHLREQEFTPVAVNEIPVNITQTVRKTHRKRIKSAELAALCWQLTTMVEGGIPITTALETISEDIENLRLQEVLQQVLEKMHKGETFSACISAFPRVFGQLACAMIIAGEASGSFPQAMRKLAEHFDGRDKLARKVKGAMAYPAFVLTFIVLMVVFIMTFIIPRFRAIFDQIGGELPAFTRGFMGFYDILRCNVVYIIGAILLAVFSLVLIYSRTRGGHWLFCKVALKIPLLGRVFSHAFVAMFCRTMSTLLACGVSVLEVLDILAGMTNNDVIKSAITRTRENVVGGSNISLGMAASGFFPNMVVKMAQVGEESGSLPKVLDKTADYYERKVDSTITTMMSLLEPIMIVTVGGIVLVVVLAMYLPIFTMSNVTK